MNQETQLFWDKGSGYDLFVSLWILHRPDEFGLRPSWAAGVRSRLPIPLRDVLEHSQNFLGIPLSWLHSLPEPKDSQIVIQALEKLAPEDRLPALVFGEKKGPRVEAYRDCLLSFEGKQRFSANFETRLKETINNPSR